MKAGVGQAKHCTLSVTFGSIYTTDSSRAEQMPETNNPNQTQQGYESQVAVGNPVEWLFTSVVEVLNSGLPRTNPASSQGGT